MNPAKPPAKYLPPWIKTSSNEKLVQRKPEDHETVKPCSPFNHNIFGPIADFGRRFNQRIFSRKLSCFLIIDCYYIYPLSLQVNLAMRNPSKIHGI
jgi:hypothetical protein